MTPYLLAMPWLGLLLWVRFGTRLPTELAEESSGGRSSDAWPSLSVVVPARNEAINIVGCLRSLTSSDYPSFEIVVVDDRSEDFTAELARSVPRRNAARITVIDGRPLPPGWLGKPWACHQGVQAATGELVLFTDADTRHGPQLARRAAGAVEEDGADLMTVIGRQLMETFWERLVQPHIFLLMLMRFPDFEALARNRRWRDAVANGQFLLFRRSAYEAIGGHAAVRNEVAEDLALAQRVKRSGLRLRIRGAERHLATRMYRSLPQLVEGWSKNVVMGGLQTFSPWFRPVLPVASLMVEIGFWLVAPAVLVAWSAGSAIDAWPAVVAGVDSGQLVLWAATVYGLSAVLWGDWTRRMGTLPLYGALYPLGAGVASYILLRAWVRGPSVEWKGRRYRLPPVSERA
jgi:chlorobactene glucosyltransferase